MKACAVEVPDPKYVYIYIYMYICIGGGHVGDRPPYLRSTFFDVFGEFIATRLNMVYCKSYKRTIVTYCLGGQASTIGNHFPFAVSTD